MQKIMLKKAKGAITILACLLLTQTVKSQYVTLPDTVFINWLTGHGFSGCMSGNQLDTTCALVLSTDTLLVGNLHIRDLTGVQYFKNLVYLECSNDSLYNIPALPTKLNFFNCAYNKLTSLPPLGDSLSQFQCAFNQLTSLPALPAPLQLLDCGSNALSTLPALPNGIFTLYCDVNNLVSLPTLPSNLRGLACNNNQLTSLPALNNQLINLNCYANQLTALPPLPASLSYLDTRYNQLTVIPTLPVLMSYLDCSGNQLTGLPTLPPTLQYLFCEANSIIAIPPIPNTVTNFTCSYNQLTSLPTLPDSLYNFWCDGNANLTCLPQLKRIVNFTFTGTGITCLPDYGSITSSNPSLGSYPLCGIFNTAGCGVYWNISGQVYYDSNGDCQFDGADAGQGYVKMSLTSGGMQQQVYSSDGGYYSFLGNINTNYLITLDTSNVPFRLTCPSSGYIASTVTGTDSFSTANNFAMQCRTAGFDLGVHCIVNSWVVPRPATPFALFTAAGDISDLYGAHCAAGISGQVVLTYTGEVTYTGVAPGALAPTSVNGNVITWDIPDFGVVDDRTAFNTLFYVDSTATAGTQACFTVNVTPLTGDYNMANNTGYFCFTIVNALDPNEKEVSPAGKVDTGQWLTYTIRFQNTGSAAAVNVRVTDTLDNSLDPSTFQLLGYSAKNLTQLFGNVVVFNFPNINLADSATSDSASRGYVQYKIKMKSDLPIGTQIHNTANIYFDLNSAVVTNTTSNTVALPTGIAPAPVISSLMFNLYPNPAKDYTTISISDDLIGSHLQLTDAVGRVILAGQITTGRFNLSTGTLAKGIYLVKVSEDGVGEMVKKLVVQ